MLTTIAVLSLLVTSFIYLCYMNKLCGSAFTVPVHNYMVSEHISLLQNSLLKQQLLHK